MLILGKEFVKRCTNEAVELKNFCLKNWLSNSFFYFIQMNT